MLEDKNRHGYLYDYRLWILFTVLLKIYGIWNPPLEAWHTWRQSNVLMVARNFFDDPNIFYPKIDSNGAFSGITGMEFPLFNYLIYLCVKFFGPSFIYGRLINLIISTVGVFYFYKIVKRFVSQEQALFAMILLSFSEWFMFSRKIMPDTISISLVIISLYFAIDYLFEKQSKRSFTLYIFFALFGGLIKLPALIILAPLTCWFFSNNTLKLGYKALFIGASSLVLFPCLVWYLYWFPHLVDTYGLFYYFVGNSLSEGVYEIFSNFGAALSRFYKSALGFSGFIAFVVGVYYLLKNGSILTKGTILFVFLASFTFILKAGFAFHHHDYYILPLVPFMALSGSYLYKVVNRKWLIIFTSIFVLEGFLTQMKDLSLKESNREQLSYEAEWNKLGITDAEKVIVNNGKNPTPLFFLNKEGWILKNDVLHSNSDTILYAIKHGANYAIIFNNHDRSAKHFKKFGFLEVGSNEYFNVFKLDSLNFKLRKNF